MHPPCTEGQTNLHEALCRETIQEPKAGRFRPRPTSRAIWYLNGQSTGDESQFGPYPPHATSTARVTKVMKCEEQLLRLRKVLHTRPFDWARWRPIRIFVVDKATAECTSVAVCYTGGWPQNCSPLEHRGQDDGVWTPILTAGRRPAVSGLDQISILGNSEVGPMLATVTCKSRSRSVA
jgi:hypothetical protein